MIHLLFAAPILPALRLLHNNNENDNESSDSRPQSPVSCSSSESSSSSSSSHAFFLNSPEIIKHLFNGKRRGGEEDIHLSFSTDELSSPPSFASSDISYQSFDELSHVTIKNMLGPKVELDEQSHDLPKDFKKPLNLEHCMEMDLPVGYFRLRRGFLRSNNEFWDEMVLSETLNYSKITSNGWDQHEDVIGLPTIPSNIEPSSIIGTTKTTEYLMPKTALVKANMAYETTTITEYNDHCFAIEMKTTNPDVPYGEQFIAHTKIVVYNKGENACQMVCSVETIFPNGPPMGVGWSIKKGMKNGSMEVFGKIGRSIKECVTHDW